MWKSGNTELLKYIYMYQLQYFMKIYLSLSIFEHVQNTSDIEKSSELPYFSGNLVILSAIRKKRDKIHTIVK